MAREMPASASMTDTHAPHPTRLPGPSARVMRAHIFLSLLFVLSRVALDVAGVRFQFSLDWMWLSDPADLRDRLLETLYYFHAFPPGMNLLTGLLLKLGGSQAGALGHATFWALGLVFVNSIFYVGRVSGLSAPVALGVAIVFSLTPPSIYFEHLYLYEWPVATLLCLAAALFHKGVRGSSFGVWLACFSVCVAIGFTRSIFHLAWFAAFVGLGVWFSEGRARRIALAAASAPAAVLVALYLKNFVVFGEFAASTFGPANLTLVTVAHLPADVRDEWIEEGILSPFAAISVYAPPRDYSRFFDTPESTDWPPQMTRLEQTHVSAANFNHWWLLDVHRARRADVLHYLQMRTRDYVANVLRGVEDFLRPSTTWHPRDGTTASPHHQHRQVFGRYEAWYIRLVHSFPVAPIGLYAFVPVPVVWAFLRARSLVRRGDTTARARGALLYLCVFQIVFVFAVSTMLTSLESARYRYQIEWIVWVITALCLSSLSGPVHKYGPHRGRRGARPARREEEEYRGVFDRRATPRAPGPQRVGVGRRGKTMLP